VESFPPENWTTFINNHTPKEFRYLFQNVTLLFKNSKLYPLDSFFFIIPQILMFVNQKKRKVAKEKKI
jgi:hypothetical protein